METTNWPPEDAVYLQRRRMMAILVSGLAVWLAVIGGMAMFG